MSQTALTVGTEYLDRKITGTGTEDNPWIIGSIEGDTDENMFQNFLDAVYTDNAYVKLVHDIDVSQIKAYREGLGTFICVRARKTYADDSKAAIKNLITKQKLIDNGTVGREISNIQFLNCIINDAIGVISASGSYGGGVFPKYCDFSLLVRGTGSSVPILQAILDHCSLDVKLINGYFSGGSFSKATNCQFNIVGESTSNTVIFDSLTKCGITGKIIYTKSTNSNYFATKNSYCYFALDLIGDNAITFQNATGSYQNTNTYFCINYDENITPLNETVYLPITPEQLKSKEYLYEIGFLP